MSPGEPLIHVADLSKAYGTRPAVAGVGLRLMPGETIGLVGANGGGKTTTLRMLAGLVRPDGGTGQVLGHDIDDCSTARRRGTGYMAQPLSLYPELTVRENLRFRADAHGLDDPAAAIADGIARWMLETVIDTRFAHLSGGWGRRVQFAATMLHVPPLLLLDEPTAGLDVVTRNQIWRWLGDLTARGHGVVISTHDLIEAERCPSVLFYRDGVAQGPMPPGELIALSGAATLETAVAALALDGPA